MLELITLGPRNPWTIFDELESLQADVSRFFADAEAPRVKRARCAYPPLNVWSSADGLVIDAEIPGIDPDQVEVSVDGDELVLRGKINVEALPEGETLLRRERPTGEFQRTLQLPFRANAPAVKATSRNGVLRISVPRSEEEKPRKIAIESA